MIVSWNWLKEYVRLDMSATVLADRLMMAGLNHEKTHEREGDLAIELEVTSNRPDCLSHLGIAREVSVLFGHALKVPAAQPVQGSASVGSLTGVTLECPEKCYRFTARVIQGVKIGPSPEWMQRRLWAVGVAAINNVVDATNYVMLECGQPLHAFDLDKLAERRIVVRGGRKGERIVAINQRTYDVTPEMCVIADAARAVAVGGVMGGLETEVSAGTANLLIEAAQFDPLILRNTSRALGLMSEASHRFERGVNPAGIDWASRRACELILQLAGGDLAAGVVYAGPPPPPREPVALRFGRIERILGIALAADEAVGILERLGLTVESRDADRVVLRPPAWRSDLTREIDLIEEIGRIHGYEEVPEDRRIAVRSFTPAPRQRIVGRLRGLLCGAGFDEAVTLSLIDDASAEAFSPWSEAAPLHVEHPSRRRERAVRKSLVPSLLAARRRNEAHGNTETELFEIARVYLPAAAERLPDEPLMIGLACGRDFTGLKGVCEAIARSLNPAAVVDARPVPNSANHAWFAPGAGAELWLGERLWGIVGILSDALAERFELQRPAAVAELRVDALEAIARLLPRYEPVVAFPASHRELSLVVDESVTWRELRDAVRSAAGAALEDLQFLDLYRGTQVASGKKSLHFALVYRARDRTLTNDEVEGFQQSVVSACQTKLAAVLRV